MYRFEPDEIDSERADHQALLQGTKGDDRDAKRVGNLGEIAFERFCREYLPAEMWTWMNEEAIRRCNPESFSKYDFEVFGFEVDVKTSRDISAFTPEALAENDDEDDIIVMVWHRDNEDALILLGWEWVDTITTKIEMEEKYTGETPAKLEPIAASPMNELIDLGPNTAHLNQMPENPFSPGDRVKKKEGHRGDPAVVIEVLPPETEASIYGNTMEEEAVNVAFPDHLDGGPGDWETIHAAKLASYCDDQDIKLYTYKHSNLRFAEE
ncbi:hypothetical protein U3A55_12375 [Salarchaeum sp. III]|uniref:hypothetical protein n=1 Tax=Salarchaeum sp. III TaxID=3107927 RepID=UPI002ED79665